MIRSFGIACLVLLPAGCRHLDGPGSASFARELDAAFDQWVPPLSVEEGIVMRVEAPGLDAPWTRARGAGVDGGQSLRIASLTKTFVAAASLRLVERGAWRLDDSITPYLPLRLAALLRADGYDLPAMTVRMLLGHTAGLYDYAEDPGFQARVMRDPGHVWTREEQVAIAMRAGAPLAAPGRRFAYSDTGYLLLGAMIETLSGEPLPAAVRRLLEFERLGLAHTWFETLETAPADAPPRARQFVGRLDVQAIDPSADLFGGGGLVSTPENLARFYRALLEGRVLGPQALAAMTTPSPQSRAGTEAGYGLGLSRHQAGGLVCFGHGGFWGVIAWHCPDAGLTVVGVVTNTTHREALMLLMREVVAIGTMPRWSSTSAAARARGGTPAGAHRRRPSRIAADD